MSNNPYSKASDAYGNTAAATNQRMLEGQILQKAAHRMDQLCQQLEKPEGAPLEMVHDTLSYNQKLWTVFANDMMNEQHELPGDIKNNIASLAVFVFKRTKDIMIDPKAEKIRPLIEINRNIAAGLMKQPAGATPPPSKAPDPSAQGVKKEDSFI